MFKKILPHPIYTTWINIVIAIVASIVSVVGVVFYQYQNIIMWSVVFTLMLINLCISSYFIYYYIKNNHYTNHQKIKYGIELSLQLILLIVVFSLSMYTFYGILLICSNLIYVVYWSCIFERRSHMEVLSDETI